MKAAANKQEKKPLTEAQIVAKDARLDTQVARLNSKLNPAQHLDPERVKEVAKERKYDNVFYASLGRIERNAEKGIDTINPYEYLTTGRVSEAGSLHMTMDDNSFPTPTYPKEEQKRDAPAGIMSTMERTIHKLSRAIAPKSKAQDVRSEAEKEQDSEYEM